MRKAKVHFVLRNTYITECLTYIALSSRFHFDGLQQLVLEKYGFCSGRHLGYSSMTRNLEQHVQ